MREQELKKLQASIWARVTADDEQANPDGLFGYQNTINIQFATKNRTACIDHWGIVSHKEAQEIINRINGFYSRISPEEIEILNIDTIQCSHCKEQLTVDEFYPIKSIPNRLGLEFTATESGDLYSAFCRQCTYKVPIDIGEETTLGFVYLAVTGEAYKIGYSANPDQRVKTLNKEYPGIELIATIRVRNPFAAEGRLHSIFLHRHITRELFGLTTNDVSRIIDLSK